MTNKKVKEIKSKSKSKLKRYKKENYPRVIEFVTDKKQNNKLKIKTKIAKKKNDAK